MKAKRTPLATIAAGLIAATCAGGALAGGDEAIVVDTIEDRVDFGGAQQVNDLPGPDGAISFREATIAANNTAGPQTIHFAIPQNEWWLYSDRAILRLEDGIFILSDDGTTVDFRTQTDFTGDTNPDGWEVGIYGVQANAWGVTAILVSGNDCTILGLDRVMQRGHGVQLSGNNNSVRSCTISGPLYSGVYIHGNYDGPAATGNVVGGTDPNDGNFLSAGNDGVRIDSPAEDNVVIGNVLTGYFNGVAVRGSPYTSPPRNNRIGGPTPEERNVISGAGHYGEEGFPDGTQVKVEYAFGTIVEGNYIGTTPDGMASEGQVGPTGVRIRESEGTVVRGNLIGGLRVQGTNHYAGQLFGVGIDVNGDSVDTLIVGNRIGTDAAGVGAIPNLNGVSAAWFDGVPTNTTIGGPDPGEGNVIAFNERSGVIVSSSVSGVTISGNAIFDNGLLGIDLLSNTGQTGVNPNDVGDADSGANMLQNFPVLDAAVSDGASTTVSGTFNSRPARSYTLEFFANEMCDTSGHGEGATFLGATDVTTDAGGNAAFEATLPAAVEAGMFVTATATDLGTGDTSEFSACREAEGGTIPGDLDGDGDVDLTDLSILLGIYGTCDGDAGFDPAVDIDGSGCVDLADLSVLLGNYGS